MSDCLFCKIIAGDIPAEKIYDDDDLIAFRDIAPQAPQHILIVPRKHLINLSDMAEADDALVGKMMRVAAKIAADNGIGDGYRTIINNGAPAGQEIFHLHMHILGGKPLGPLVSR